MKAIDTHAYDPADLLRWFPEYQHPQDENHQAPWDGKVFEIGLALAGAVSGGAYAAGAMDFLFEAMDAWEAAKARGEDVPQHSVQLKMIAGASAGSINGAIAATIGTTDFKPLHYFPYKPADTRGDANPFYRTWVRQVDICGLLGHGDVDASGVPDSLLDSTGLDAVARDLFSLADSLPLKERAWLGQHWPMTFTASNLNGVPYRLEFGIQAGLVPYGMRLHADRLSFAVPNTRSAGLGAYAPDHTVLPSAGSRSTSPQWQQLISAALASGAFPVALAARKLQREAKHYQWRFISRDRAGDWYHGAPDIPEGPVEFEFVDGGAMDNEPFELVLKALAGSRGELPATGPDARAAVVMIAPFNEPKASAAIAPAGIFDKLPPLLNALISQARFKSDDLITADFGKNYNRFMITPHRNKERMKPGQPVLASGALGAFLGFFSEAYRHHDFFLGRRNAQRFLRDFFVLPYDPAKPAESNPIGQHFSVAARAAYRSQREGRENHLQIIPLVGGLGTGAGDTAIPVPWPDTVAPDTDKIKGLMDQRLALLFRHGRDIAEQKLNLHGIKRRALDFALDWAEPRLRDYVLGKALEQIETAIRQVREGSTPKT